MARFISRTLNVYLIFILFSGSCQSTRSKINRLESRVNILEDKVDYNSDVFAEDIQILFSLVNITDTECVETTTPVGSSSRVEDKGTVQRLAVSLRKAFQQEKTLLRSMEQQLQQNWTRAKRDLTSRLTDIQTAVDKKEHDINTMLDGIREEQLSLQQNYQSAFNDIGNLDNMLAITKDKQDQLITKLDNFNDQQTKIEIQLTHKLHNLETVVIKLKNQTNEQILPLLSTTKNRQQVMSESIGELQKMLANVQDKQKQIETNMTNRLNLLLSDVNIVSEKQKKFNTAVQSLTNQDRLLGPIMIANGWKKYGSKYYLFYREYFNLRDARNYCVSLGAELVEINTSGENSFVKARVKELLRGDTWINGYRSGSTWRWRNGNTMTGRFTDWASGEPSRGSETCVELWIHSSYQWNNVVCEDSNYVVCEFSF